MRSYDAPTLAALQTRSAVVVRILIWVAARNRTTGDPETLGLWTGAYDRDFTINGGTRAYAGAGGIMEIPPIKYQSGLGVRMQRMVLSPISTVVADLIRTYDSRFAPIEIHRALFSPLDGSLVAEPHRLWKGFVDEVEVKETGTPGEATCEVVAASSARLLTRTLTLKASDATQQLRGGDRFRKYADVSGKVDVWWGEMKGGGGGSGGGGLLGPILALPGGIAPPPQPAPAPQPPTLPAGGLGGLLRR
ncbi:MAG: hypothetical protein MUE52_04480 [Tabrizicola sp.]|jgi:hypothetical protein|nr:hypothetical protein [Tabrizicola sp.]